MFIEREALQNIRKGQVTNKNAIRDGKTFLLVSLDSEGSRFQLVVKAIGEPYKSAEEGYLARFRTRTVHPNEEREMLLPLEQLGVGCCEQVRLDTVRWLVDLDMPQRSS